MPFIDFSCLVIVLYVSKTLNRKVTEDSTYSNTIRPRKIHKLSDCEIASLSAGDFEILLEHLNISILGLPPVWQPADFPFQPHKYLVRLEDLYIFASSITEKEYAKKILERKYDIEIEYNRLVSVYTKSHKDTYSTDTDWLQKRAKTWPYLIQKYCVDKYTQYKGGMVWKKPPINYGVEYNYDGLVQLFYCISYNSKKTYLPFAKYYNGDLNNTNKVQKFIVKN